MKPKVLDEYFQLKRDFNKHSQELEKTKQLLKEVRLTKEARLKELNQKMSEAASCEGRTNTYYVCHSYTTTSYRWRAYSLLAHIHSQFYKKPIKVAQTLTSEIKSAFTMMGRVPFKEHIMDLSTPANCPMIFTQQEADNCLAKAKNDAANPVKRSQAELAKLAIDNGTPEWAFDLGQKCNGTIPDSETFKTLVQSTGAKKIAFTHSKNLQLTGEIILMGLDLTILTESPVQNKTNCLKCKTIEESLSQGERFDLVCCLSQIEHLGIGIWGDKIDPNADFAHMNQIQQLLNPNGRCILFLPIGQDYVWYNLGRIYGETRLPKLLAGWEILPPTTIPKMQSPDVVPQSTFLLLRKLS
jgi:hypothetical protein